MKNLICLIVLLSVICKVQSQDLTISFQPKVSDNQIDSIQATNLKTNQTVKLLGGESLLLVKTLTGMNPLKDNPETGYIYPNPTNEDADFSFSTNKSQEVEIRLYNISGQLMSRNKQNLAQGTHRFRLKFPAAGIYYLSVLKNDGPASFNAVYTGKMQNSSVLYLGSQTLNSQNAGADLIKSATTDKTLNYKDGDVILYSFFSGRNTTILTDIPATSKTIDVEFVSCIDNDNKSYKVVKIDDQWWMAENLAYLPAVNPPSALSATSPYFYVYDYSDTDVTAARATANYTTYGVLYNWTAALEAYPPGWHLPGDAEWKQLEMALGMTQAQADSSEWHGTDEGKQMKAANGWINNGNGANTSGFSGLPGGNLTNTGIFDYIENGGFWWSSTRSSTLSAWYRALDSSHGGVYRKSINKGSGFSVRCIKGALPSLTSLSITNISSTTATSGGDITSEGSSAITDRGVCWDTSQNPTTNTSSKTTNGTGTGSFASNLTDLTAGTPYYVRAYATNSQGTAYGNQLTFTTGKAITQPIVTTTAFTAVTQTTATGGGNVTDDGGAEVTSRGICWSDRANPTTGNSKTTDGTGTGSFASNLTGLTASTLFYVRAYATNSKGTAYGSQVTFTTESPLTVTTTTITDITQTTATGGGNVTADGGATVTARGICWNTTGNPTIASSKTTNGTGTGNFTSNLTGLTANTPYNVRAYASNSAGTAYGNEVAFITSSDSNLTGTFTDSRDGHIYKTIKIGDQVWMAENLAYLPAVSLSSAGSYTEPYYYVYGYEFTSVVAAKTNPKYTTYGVLYNWTAALAACPPGWHLPSDDEWTALTTWLGGEAVAGDKMKETGITHWLSPNTGATNISGFTGLPGGFRDEYGGFNIVLEAAGYWWSSTEYTNSAAYYRFMNWSESAVGRSDRDKGRGFSVRCVRD